MDTLTDTQPRHRREYETDGIAQAECLVCGHVATEPLDLDLWNGYGDCPAPTGHHDRQHVRWTRTDGSACITRQDDPDGDGPTFTEVPAPTTRP